MMLMMATGTGKVNLAAIELDTSFFTGIFFLIYSYVHTLFGPFLPPNLRPLSLPPAPLTFGAESVLPLSLILLTREYKQ
jgi:hypothetical protein